MLLFFSIVHVLLCIFMMFVILLQPGKDAGMGAALGGGAATTAFGGRGAVTFLGKLTAACAIAYFITSLGLSFVGLKQSVTAKVAAPVSAPASPSTEAPKSSDTTPSAGQGSPDQPPGKAVPPAKATTGTEGVPAEKAPPAK